MEQFIGEKKVLVVIELPELKTPAGMPMVEVSFEDGTKEIMPKKRLETVCKSSEKGGEPLEDKKLLQDMLANTMLGVMMEFGVKLGEVDEILDAVTNRVNRLFNKACEMSFGFEKIFTPLSTLNNLEVESFKKNENN